MNALLVSLMILSVSCVPSQAQRAESQSAKAGWSRPAEVRGLYVNRWAVLEPRLWNLVALARRTEVNAFVIDVKDDRGYVLYRSSVPLAREIGADTTQPVPAERMHAFLDSMRAIGIHPIARIVVAKDPLLASAKHEWAIRRKDTGAPWLDVDGRPWLDAHERGVWQYAGDLAAEAVSMGFAEVQFDYVRFPDDPRLVREAVFPLDASARTTVIHDQLAYLHERMRALHVPMAIDVFGLTTTDESDMGIGQRWERFADVTDIVQPMTYPSHYSAGSYGLANPNAQPYAVIAHAMHDALARNAKVTPAPKIVPWYQDFTQGAPPYGAAEVRAQMRAGYDAGVRSWLLWNPGSQYTADALAPKH